MSITKGFEGKLLRARNFVPDAKVFMSTDVKSLLDHARALEAMLKKHEWCIEGIYTDSVCPECGGGRRLNGHSPDCQLAKLLEGVEDSHE